MKGSELIREARSVLFERGWAQSSIEKPDGSVGALGACLIAKYGATRHSASCSPAYEFLAAAAEGRSVACFNNDPDRTFEEIIDWFDKAEKIAEQREAEA